MKPNNEWQEQEDRIGSILGGSWDVDFDEGKAIFLKHLRKCLVLPCEVTGTEDFNWEEPYVFGRYSADEYEEARKTRPSFLDVFELLSIEEEGYPEWFLRDDDLAACVRRKSDGQEFDLALSELKTVDESHPNHELLDDYSFWFWNCR
jgi:hypothetical protein